MGVKLEIADFVAVVTLDRPPVNAIDNDMRHAIIRVFDEIGDRTDVRATILTATGKVFCAGVDMRARPDPDRAGALRAANRLTRDVLDAVTACPKPIIAAVQGTALGFGFGLAAHCDIMLASETAVFGMPEIDVGLAGGAAMLLGLLPRGKARRMLYTGQRIGAAELYRLGGLEACTAPEALLPEAHSIAAEIAAKSPAGIRYFKRSLGFAALLPEDEAYKLEQEFTTELARTADAKEARAAFLEKRPPRFTN